jgi:fibro-slime domain-containing protein
MNTARSHRSAPLAPDAQPGHRRPRARGVAVILALVAVGAAVVLSLALASTRDQGALTSDSVVRVAAARAASAGSLDIACALVEQHGLSGFGSISVASPVLFSPVTIGGRVYSAEVRDLSTNDPIGSNTIAVRILAKAQSDGITQTSTAVGRLVQHDTVVRADVDLSEFGLLSTSSNPSSIRFTEGSTLGVWSAAPLAQLREPVMIGSSALNEDAVEVGSQARLRGYTVLTRGEFPETDEEVDTALASKTFPLPHEIHVPETPRPGRSAFAYEYDLDSAVLDDLLVYLNPPPLPDPLLPSAFSSALGNMNLMGDLDLTGAGSIAGTSGANELLIGGSGDPSLATWRQIDISGDLSMGGGDRIKIQVPTMLIVRGDLRMSGSEISVAENTPFTLVVFGSVEITNSDILLAPTFAEVADPATYYGGGASKIMIYATMDGRESLSSNTPSERSFDVQNSDIHAQIYAPSRLLRFGSSSNLFGRALGMEIEFLTDSNFYYDPALNEGRGWSNPTSGLWADAENPRPEVMRIAELNDASVSLGTADDGSQSALSPSDSVVAIDPPGGSIVVPAHAAFIGGTPRNYDQIIESILSNVTDPDEVKGGSVPNRITLGAIVRDFNEQRSPNGHSDFEKMLKNTKLFQRIVQATLDQRGKPVYSGNPMIKSVAYKEGSEEICWAITVSGDSAQYLGDESGEGDFELDGEGSSDPAVKPVKDGSSFAEWFADKPGVNMSMPAAVEFVRNGPFREFTVTELNNPVKGSLYGDLPSLADAADQAKKNAQQNAIENGNFTMEFALGFKRDTSQSGGSQTFVVQTTGDAWVYINGTLALEIVSKKGNPMQAQKVPMDRLAIENNSHGEIRIFYANRTKGPPHLEFRGNFPMWQDVDWLKSAQFTEPAAARDSLERVADRAEAAKESGNLAEMPTIYAERSGNWSRRIEPAAEVASANPS